MVSTFRNTALAAVAAMLFLGGAGQARADILYLVANPVVTFSWEAPTFITLPTSGNPGPVDITGLVSCTVLGAPCANTPTLGFIPGPPGGIIPDTILAGDSVGGAGFGGFFLPSDFGAVGAYTDAFDPSRATLTVSTAIPEPSTWALMALGFALIAAAGYLPQRRRTPGIASHS